MEFSSLEAMKASDGNRHVYVIYKFLYSFVFSKREKTETDDF